MIGHIQHLLFPHSSNNHRPKILHHNVLSFVVFALLLISIVVPQLQRSYPSVLGITSNIAISDLLVLTNQKRAENGLPPLNLNSQLSSAAQGKAADMFSQNYWAHIAPNGTTPWYFINNSGYRYIYAGENLARGFNSAPEVVDAWMASPTHRENMLSGNYTDIGFAVSTGTLTGSETVLVVQMFGSGSVAQQDATQPVAQVAPTAAPIVITQVPIVQSQPNVPTSEVIPTPADIVTRTIVPTNSPIVSSDTTVAALSNRPLINSVSTTRSIAFFVLGLFITILLVDAIFIERNKIKRLVSHNLDHIVFLAILIIAAIIIGRGAVL